jgi:hypothetical protein
MLKDLSGSFCYYRAMNNTPSQKGSAPVAIVLALAIAIIGTLGFVAWSKFFNQKDANFVQTTDSVKDEAEKPDSNKTQPDPNEGYLVLEGWGIKYKIPENSGEIRYYKSDFSTQEGITEGYSFSTKRVEELGGYCAPDSNVNQIYLKSTSRTQTKQEGPFASAEAANNNEPINGYYYYISGGQQPCSNDHSEWQEADLRMISDMLQSPVVAE